MSRRGPCAPSDPWGVPFSHNGVPRCPQGPRWGTELWTDLVVHITSKSLPIFLSTFMWTEIWTEFIFRARSGRRTFSRGAFSGGQMCRPASLKRARSGGKKWPRSAKKKPVWPPLLPGSQKFPYTFLLKRGVKRGHFAILSARLRRAKIPYYIYHFYRFSENFDRDPTAERWCDVYAVTTFFQKRENQKRSNRT